VGLRVGLDRRGKSRPLRDSIPGPPSPKAVAILTELPGPRARFLLLINAVTGAAGRRTALSSQRREATVDCSAQRISKRPTTEILVMLLNLSKSTGYFIYKEI
jgi:hypothetical protein